MKKKTFFIILTCAIFLLVFLCIGAFCSYRYFKYTYPRNTKNISHVEISLEKQESLKTFSKKLKILNIINDDFYFYLWVKLFSDYKKYKSGRYLFDGDIGVFDIDQKIITGDIYEPVVLKITIPEGFNFRQICKRISKKNVGTFESCLSLLHDEALLKKYCIAGNSIEGYLFPSTYTFTKIPTTIEIIEKMIDTFFKKLPRNYLEDISDIGLSLNDAVTFASLIELESADPTERRKIAGVIWNRLNAHMLLGIDASIIYGIDNYNGNLSKSHLEDKENKFNTRVFVGLPPTPIASPSLDALYAVINPEKHKYYYYVLDYENKKKHLFSKNLSEHNTLVRKLVKSYKAKR